MEVLQKIIIENELAEMKDAIMALHETWMKAKKQDKQLNEGVLDFESEDLSYMFDEAKKRYMAAMNAVKIVNKLNDPAQKSRVWSNLNKLRGFIKRLDNTIAAEVEQILQKAKGTQLFQQQPGGNVQGQPSRNQDTTGGAPQRPVQQQAPQQPQQA
jgi:hypothetical protein